MSFELRPPDPRLSTVIVGYWRLAGLKPGRPYTAAPKRHVELVINVGAPQLAGPGKYMAGVEYAACWVTGLRNAPLHLAATGESVTYGVRFQDFAVPDWLCGGVVRNPRWSTDLSRSGPTAKLVAAIGECADLDAAATVFDRFFLARRSADREADRLRAAVQACERDGSLTPAAILQKLAGSPRRPRRLARANGGVTLRYFARLARFDRALVQLERAPDLRLADVAQDVGYYDEAHMAHDFAELFGTSPAVCRRLRQETGCAALPHHLLSR